jgi:undecaprenyl-phosphate 4-deoxy-4-formamido-L-arabinose transferase
VFLVGRAVLVQTPISGGEATIILSLSLAGLQLLGLGVMGEYLGRILLNVNGKPQYFERQILNIVQPAISDHSGRRVHDRRDQFQKTA